MWTRVESNREDRSSFAKNRKRANGNELHDDNTLMLVKDLAVKRIPKPVKTGNKVKNIRLTKDNHKISRFGLWL